jgi:Xaa-Pro aminopeptidase
VSGLEIPPEEFEDRRRRVRERARERGLAGLVVWSRNATTVDWYGDVLYLSNHHTPFPQLPDNLPVWAGRSHSVLVLPVDGDPVLVVDTVEYRRDLVRVDDVRIGLNVPATVAAVLRDTGLAREPLGVVGRESLLLSSYEILREELGGELDTVPVDDILAEARRVKSDAELSLVRHAADVGVECVTAIMEAIGPGRTEGDVVGEGLRVAARRGAFPYDVAVTSGPHSESFQWARLPSWDTTRRLQAGDLIHVDFWGPVLAYYTDFVRSSVVGGRATQSQLELLEGAIAFVEHVVAAIKPGVTFGELWTRGSDWLAENGFDGREVADSRPGETSVADMYPGFGHCIGLGVEGPYVMPGAPAWVEERMVIAIEILLSRAGVGGAGFEQDVVVTADGADVITRACPARWWA